MSESEFLETSRLSEFRNAMEKKSGADWYEKQCLELRDELQGKHVRKQKIAILKAELPQRLISAVAGTACLVAPMLIMSLHQTRTKSLITASVSVLVLGIGLAVGSAFKVGELLAALAAYAAVLVVFVGVSGP